MEEELEQALRDIQTANKSDEDKLKQAKKERGYSEDDMKNILRNPSMKKPETSSQSSKYQVDSTPLLAADSSSSSPKVVIVCCLFVVIKLENCLLTAT